MDKHREFTLLFEQTGLSQRDLASLIGKSPVSVNRYFAHGRPDYCEPPFILMQFLRMYLMLKPPARARLTTSDGRLVKTAPVDD